MEIRNLGFAASNESRFFPFDESASFVDDAGARPPLQLFADMKIMTPLGSGRYVYIGAMSVTPHIVTAIFMASDDLEVGGSVIASISQTLPITLYYPYAVSGQIDGVGGWVSFGSVKDFLYQGKFSTPRQSLLSPLAARWFKAPPISSVRAQGAAGLKGLVKLKGGNDFEIVKQCVHIPSHAVAPYHENYCSGDGEDNNFREAIVFNIKNTATDATRNVFDIYSGPCAPRPQSRNCGNPEPIEFIGPVAPDCDGNINIDLRGCIEVLPVRTVVSYDEFGDPVHNEDSSGVVLFCPLSLENACASNLPGGGGTFPTDYENECESVSYISTTDPEEGFTPPAYTFDGGESAAAYEPPVTPEIESPDWKRRYGSFVTEDACNSLSEGSSLSESASPLSCPSLVGGVYSRNALVYSPGSAPTGFYKQVKAIVSLEQSGVGALHNASVIINYQNGVYYVAEIDWDGHYRGYKLFRIAKFDGTKWATLTSTPVPELKTGDYYQLSIKSSPASDGTGGWLSADLSAIGSDLSKSLGPTYAADYAPAAGLCGIGTNRSAARFTEFRVESFS
jgi:hypothetical protein